jgi:hypothetical protein
VIRIPIASPKDARIVSSPRIFQDLAPAPSNSARQSADSVDRAARGGGGGAAGRAGGGGGGRASGPPTGPNQCHDITTYPALGLAGGACGGYGLLLDIRDVASPRRVDAAADPISPSGTRPRSTTTARRSSSPTNGAVAAHPSAARRTSMSGAETRCLRSRTTR